MLTDTKTFDSFLCLKGTSTILQMNKNVENLHLFLKLLVQRMHCSKSKS